MPKSRQRWVTSLSSSSKESSSSSNSMRSRAESLPSLCCRACRSGPPPCSAAIWRRRSSSRRFIGTIVTVAYTRYIEGGERIQVTNEERQFFEEMFQARDRETHRLTSDATKFFEE